MYILRTIQLNYQENKFFVDSEFFDESLTTSMVNESIKSEFLFSDSLMGNSQRYYDDNEQAWCLLNDQYFYKSIETAEKYFLNVVNDKSKYRTIMRDWATDHKILSKNYILDKNYQIVKTITDCEQHVCIRFGGRCSDSGCDKTSVVKTIQFLKSNRLIKI